MPTNQLSLEKWVSIQETAIAILLASEVALSLERPKARADLERRIKSLDEAKLRIGNYARSLQENLDTNRARAEHLDSALAQLEDLWSAM